MKKRLLLGAILVLLLLVCAVSAMAESGTYDGISWDLTDGVLTLGREGETQTLVNRSYRDKASWPWNSQRSSITACVVNGDLVMQGSLEGMFQGCSGIKSLDLSLFNTSRVTNITNMFYGCSGLTSLDVSSFNTSNVTDMGHTFRGCSSLTSLDVSSFDTSKVTNMYYMFNGCSNLTSLDVATWNVGNVLYMSCMFEGCGKLAELDVSEWNVGKVQQMGSMFKGCRSLTTIPLANWDVKSLYDSNNMFNSCGGLQTLDVSRWNTINLRSIAGMFGGCGSLRELNLNSWNTSKLQGNAQWLFTYCASLTSMDLSSWDLTRISSIDTMFSGCTNLKSLNISGWDVSHISQFINMYANCSSLSEVILGEKNPFKGAGSSSIVLPTPPSQKDGIKYTRKWIREDRTFGPYTPAELRDNYTSAMAGKWVWEEVPKKYTLNFVCDEDGYLGNMPQLTVLVAEDFTLPGNAFRVFGKIFDHWTDGNGRNYNDGASILANTYGANSVVTLTAVFVPRDTSVQMQNGMFEFSIYGDEKAFFEGLPAGTSYYVSENVPEDWVLIMQSNSAGVIYPLGEAEALFVNKYQPGIAMTQFVGRKLMDEQPAEADSFSFELWEDNVLLQTKSVMEGGFVMFDAIQYDKQDAGRHEYVIKEVAGDDETVLYDGHEEIVIVQVTAVTENNGTTKVTAEVVYDEDNVVFNNWTKPGVLTLKKVVDDLRTSHENDEFRFRITFKQENGLPLEDKLTCTIEP